MFVNGEKKVLCSKGKSYQVSDPTDFEESSGILLWVDSEIDERVPLTLKYFNKYFTTIDEMRENKINQILK
jgi:hypothetical protein